MIYLLLGEEFTAKEKKVEDIKKKYLNKTDAKRFDYEHFDAAKLNPADFKKALITLPVIAKQRLVLIRNIHKLSPQNQGILLNFAQLKDTQCDVVCDCPASSQKGFLKKLAVQSEVYDSGTAKKLNVFDMTKAMGRSQSTEALRILSVLFNDGSHPLQVMGGLVWYWGNNKNRISSANFEKRITGVTAGGFEYKAVAFTSGTCGGDFSHEIEFAV